MPDGKDGYEARTDKIIEFAEVMLDAATSVDKVRAMAPLVSDWGWFDSPRVLAPFLTRLEGYVDEWRRDIATLEKVLKDDGPKLISVAKRYTAAEDAAKAGATGVTTSRSPSA
ncbi:hypothetical protein [Nonomuraea sp. NPDC002799]